MSDNPPTPVGRKRLFRRTLSIAALVGSLIFFVHFFWSQPESLSALKHTSATDFFLLIVLQVVLLLAQGVLYQFVVREFGGRRVPVPSFLRIFIVARALNFVMPQAGNLYRAVQFKSLFGISYTKYIGGFGFFTWLSLLTIFLFATITLVLVNPTFAIEGFNVAMVLVVALVLGACFPFVIAALERLPMGRRPLLVPVFDKIRSGRKAAARTLTDPLFWLVYPTMIGVTSGLSIAIAWVGFSAVGHTIDLSGLVFLFVITNLINRVPVSPGNLGVQELVYGAGTSLLGMGLAGGVLVSLLIRTAGAVMLFVLALPLGAIDTARALREEST